MSDLHGATDPPASASTAAPPAAVRRDRRPDPRLATAGAAAGCALVVIGVLTIAGDSLGGGGDGEGGTQLPGILLSALVLAGGLALLARGPSDAFRTAGSAAAILSIPPLLFFLTFDENSLPPWSTEAILGVSAAAWLALHFAGPAAGRPLPLGAGCVALWLFVLQLTEEPFTAPFDLISFFFGTAFVEDEAGDFGGDFGGGFDAPDLTTMGGVTLVAGIVLVALAHRLDGRGQQGRATALGAAGLVMLPVAPLLLANELEGVGTGLLMVAIGAALVATGSLRARRGTTWIGGAFVLVGAGTVLADLFEDPIPFGVAAAIVGAAIVVGAHAAAAALDEPGELAPGPSTFRRGQQPPRIEIF